jgi:hypothetical protein
MLLIWKDLDHSQDNSRKRDLVCDMEVEYLRQYSLINEYHT